MKRWIVMSQGDRIQQQDRVAILISDKAKLKQKLVDDKSLHIAKGKKIHQEDITNVDIYVPNFGAPNFIKQILLNVNK
jgi:hypothetical protein